MLSNSLLGLHCRHAFFFAAQKLFDKMPIRGIGTLDTLIDEFSHMSFLNQDFHMCNQSRNDTVGLDRYGYAGALDVCAQNRDLRNGKIIHGLVVVSGLANRAFLTNSLIEMYSTCEKIDEVRFVFDRADELDDISWNLLLSAYVRIGWPEAAADILVWMHRNGVRMNSLALGCVLKACSGFDDPNEAKRLLLGCVIKIGLDLHFLVGSDMHYIFAENGGLDEAIEAFECTSNRSPVLFNALIRGFPELGNETCTEAQSVALRLYVEMTKKGTRPSNLTLKSVLEACIFNKDFSFGKQIHANVIKTNLEGDEFIVSALVTVYAHNGRLENAMDLFRNSLKIGMKPSENALSSLMNGLGNLGAVRSGEQVHCYAIKEAFDQFTVCGNSHVFFYSNIGENDACTKILDDFASMDVVSWSLMILSYGINGSPKEALKIFEKMKEFEVSPKKHTFFAVLTACSHGGLIDEGLRYLESMETEYGLLPNLKHSACILDILGRDSNFSKAEDFIMKSGYNNEPIMWSALLRSCHFHADVKWSVRIAEKLMELDPLSSASYTVLYKIYLGMGKSSEAMRIRGKMRERGVSSKETDISWIEIGALVHSFVGSDSPHAQSSVISAKLKEILLRLRKKGCANASLMKSHGEIRAVAFGLILLPESVTIRVMKNARMCGDCHEMLKLFSESEERKIVVRDLLRLHHFSCGECSCGEYW